MYKFLTLLFSLFFSFGAVAAVPLDALPSPIIWGIKDSPFVRKVLLSMEYKGLPYQSKEIMPSVVLVALQQDIPDEFSKASPLGKIPAFEEGDFSIADSSIIVAYLEKTHPERSLYPQDSQLFARALWLEKYGDTVLSAVTHVLIIESVIKPLVLNEDTDKAAVKKAIEQDLPPILDYLEKQLQTPWAGGYFIGDQMTIADIAVATHLVSLKLLQVEIDANHWPELSAYFQRILEEPSFKNVLQAS